MCVVLSCPLPFLIICLSLSMFPPGLSVLFLSQAIDVTRKVVPEMYLQGLSISLGVLLAFVCMSILRTSWTEITVRFR